MNNTQAEYISSGKAVLGIEFGSTRIKAVLIGEDYMPVASGSFTWHDSLENGVWTYDLGLAVKGLQECYADLKKDVKEKYGVVLTDISACGISGMMHGYIPFDKEDKQLAPFRTWRNTITGDAAAELSEALDFNIPERWTIAHIYHAVLGKEAHVKDIAKVNTLAGYIHRLLTGVNAVGVGEASGIFPIDSETNDYDEKKLEIADAKIKAAGYDFCLRDVLPQVLVAGEYAGSLTEEGAKILDPAGDLKAGVPFCPAEGDAGTGMTATNSVCVRTGNISAGTSVFAMVVLEKQPKRHIEIDMVTTPAGKPVAMVHCNTCSSDFDAWVGLFKDFLEKMGLAYDTDKLYETLYTAALSGDKALGGMLSYNYYSGEPVSGTSAGCPVFTRRPDSEMNLANFMRAHMYSAVSTLKLGMDILTEDENAEIDSIIGHGGFFKTTDAGQKIMSAALNVPVSVMSNAGEGGPWGMAVLAAYMKDCGGSVALEKFLADKVFTNTETKTVQPDKEDVAGFAEYIKRYKNCLSIEKKASEMMYEV